MKIILALLLVVLAVSPSAAQRRDTGTAAQAAPQADTVASTRPAAAGRIFNRTMTGVLGFALLGAAGGVAGYQDTYRTEGGEDPGFGGLLLGAAAGGVTGAALAAALPEHGARCSYKTRAARGLLGAVLTSGLYIAAGAGGLGEAVLTFPIGIPLGAAVMADC